MSLFFAKVSVGHNLYVLKWIDKWDVHADDIYCVRARTAA